MAKNNVLLLPKPQNTFGQARRPRDTDCLVADSGCGYLCLDRVAPQLNLWHPHAPLSSPFAPNAFSWGPSTRHVWALLLKLKEKSSDRIEQVITVLKQALEKQVQLDMQ